jgi:hypothetical protein
MVRPYHSASSIALGDEANEGCERAWAIRYIDGIKDVDVAWADIENGADCTTKQRSCSLGKEFHARAEGYLLGQTVDLTDLPGEMLHAYMEYLPDPTACVRMHTEEAYGSHPLGLIKYVPDPQQKGNFIPTPETAHKPPTCLIIEDVKWAGFIDYMALPFPSEVRRLGAELGPAPFGSVAPIVGDHKSCANIARYAQTPATLPSDLAACLYAYAVCQQYGIDAVACRWGYSESKAVRRAAACDALITRVGALERIRIAAPIARHLDTLKSSAEARPNPAACPKYGGCPYKTSGRCDFVPSGPALMRAHIESRRKATMNPELKSKIESERATGAPPKKRRPVRQVAEAEASDPTLVHEENEAPAPRQAPVRRTTPAHPVKLGSGAPPTSQEAETEAPLTALNDPDPSSVSEEEFDAASDGVSQEPPKEPAAKPKRAKRVSREQEVRDAVMQGDPVLALATKRADLLVQVALCDADMSELITPTT